MIKSRTVNKSHAGQVDSRGILVPSSNWSRLLNEMAHATRTLPGNEPGGRACAGTTSKQQRMERREATWPLAPVRMNRSRETSWKN